MKYHEHKMREINDSIQALWSKTYQGTGEPAMHTKMALRSLEAQTSTR